MIGLGRTRAVALTAGLALLMGVLGNPVTPTESRAAPVEGEASAGTSTAGSQAPAPPEDPLQPPGGGSSTGGQGWIVWWGAPYIWIWDHGQTEQIVCSPDGFEYQEATSEPDVSDDGRIVTFAARFLVTGVSVTVVRIAVVDRRTGECTLAPPPPGPERPIIDPGAPRVDSGGLWVVWAQYCQVWAWIIGADGGPLLASGVSGQPAGGCSSQPVVERCGVVLFASTAPTLVAGDTNGYQDVFAVLGLFTPEPEDDSVLRISLNADGTQRDGPSSDPAISPDCKQTGTETTVDPPPDGPGPEQEVIVDPFPPTFPVPPDDRTVIPDGCEAGGLVLTNTTVVCQTGTPPEPGDTPTNFSVVKKDGTRRWGIHIIWRIGNRVRVGYPDDEDLNRATCGAVSQNAVIDDQILPLDLPDGRSNANPPACVGPSTDVTDGPDLDSAEITKDDAGTPGDPGDDRAAVRLCFDEAIAALVDPEGFGVTTFNSAVRFTSIAASLDPGNPACVVAFFPDGTDVSRATLATVIDGVVSDADGHANTEASRPLSGTALDPRPGDITGPNLVSAIPDVAMGTVTYTFDDIASATPGAHFTFVDDQGEVHPAGAVSAVDAGTETVVVAFPDNLGTARRLVALPDAVRNAGGEPNVEQSTDANVAGPELAAVTRVEPAADDPAGPPRFDFTFNEPVRAEDVGRLSLFTGDGTRFGVTAPTRPAPETVRVAAPALAGLEASVVLGSAQPRAVFTRLLTPTGLEVSGAPNPLGVKPLGALTFTPTSPTDGPDLVGVEVFPGEHAVDYVFDEPVRDAHLIPVNPAPVPPGGTTVTDGDTGGQQSVPGCMDPSASPDGRVVACDNGTNVTRVDTLKSEVNPDRVDFGRRPLGSDTTREVTVTNRGFTPLVLSAVSVTGVTDYRLASDGCSHQSLQGAESCRVVVAFSPGDLGARDASLLVADNAPGSPHAVALAGAGPELPVVTATPPLGAPGTPVTVRGSGFPANATVELRWARSPDRPRDPTPLAATKVVRADAAGRIGPVAFLILRDVLGPRLLSATVRGAPLSASAPFLVVPGTAQPLGSGPSRTFGRD